MISISGQNCFNTMFILVLCTFIFSKQLVKLKNTPGPPVQYILPMVNIMAFTIHVNVCLNHVYRK